MRPAFIGGIAALLALANPASAANYCGPPIAQTVYGNPAFWADQMSFRVESAGSGRVFIAEGGVDLGDGERFAAALAQAGAVDEVWLSSPGGSVDAGLKIGRVLRSKGMLVRVPTGRACISSCTLAFLGGALRTVDQNAYYGIHMFSLYSDKKSATEKMRRVSQVITEIKSQKGVDLSADVYQLVFRSIEQSAAQSAADLARYLVEMSASLEFLTGMAGQEQAGVCFVTRDGLKRYNVVNID